MKESRKISIVLILLLIAVLIIRVILNVLNITYFDYQNIAINLCCGIIVGLVTSICQYYVAKRRIINQVYNSYFEIYRCYFNVKSKPFLKHYDSWRLYKKFINVFPTISDSLDEYYGIFKKKDKTYIKLNPNVNLEKAIKAKDLNKSVSLLFNKKSFNTVFNPIIDEIEKILININEKRFLQDKIQMERLYRQLWK